MTKQDFERQVLPAWFTVFEYCIEGQSDFGIKLDILSVKVDMISKINNLFNILQV